MVVNAMATVSILIVDAAMMVAELNICDDDVRSGFKPWRWLVVVVVMVIIESMVQKPDRIDPNAKNRPETG
jgi:hypothetical protein